LFAETGIVKRFDEFWCCKQSNYVPSIHPSAFQLSIDSILLGLVHTSQFHSELLIDILLEYQKQVLIFK
jgi:hypothetical protein